jgi:hypothetical protein
MFPVKTRIFFRENKRQTGKNACGILRTYLNWVYQNLYDQSGFPEKRI